MSENTNAKLDNIENELDRVEYDYADMTKNEKIFFGTALVGVLTLFGGMVYAGIKGDKEYAEQQRLKEEEREAKAQARKDWLNEQSEKGNDVHILKDGKFLVVPRTSGYKIHIM